MLRTLHSLLLLCFFFLIFLLPWRKKDLKNRDHKVSLGDETPTVESSPLETSIQLNLSE